MQRRTEPDRDGPLLRSSTLEAGCRDAVRLERLLDLVEQVVELNKDEDAILLGDVFDERDKRLELDSKVAAGRIVSERLSFDDVGSTDPGVARLRDALAADGGGLELLVRTLVATAGEQRHAFPALILAAALSVADALEVTFRAVPADELLANAVEGRDVCAQVPHLGLAELVVGDLLATGAVLLEEFGHVLRLRCRLGRRANNASFAANVDGHLTHHSRSFLVLHLAMDLSESRKSRQLREAFDASRRRSERTHPGEEVEEVTRVRVLAADFTLVEAVALKPKMLSSGRPHHFDHLRVAVLELSNALAEDLVADVRGVAEGSGLLVHVEGEMRASLDQGLQRCNTPT